MDAVRRHHNYVLNKAKERNESVIMTVLDGSQNYGLDHDGSDIDTFSFVLPSLENISQLKEPVSTEFWVEDGKCSVKDIRLALNLVIKTSPNSIEWFTSKYQIRNLEYDNLLNKYLNSDTVNKMIRSNYFHMLKACEGMAHQLSKRNMPSGKRYSHALRIIHMWNTFVGKDYHILSFRDEESRLKALSAKLNPDEDYQEQIEELAEVMHGFADSFVRTSEMLADEIIGQRLVRQFEYELMKKHLKIDESNE